MSYSESLQQENTKLKEELKNLQTEITSTKEDLNKKLLNITFVNQT